MKHLEAKTQNLLAERKSKFVEIIRMYEYKVEVYKVKSAEKEMNMAAKEGWRVVAVSPDIAKLYGVIVTYERKKD